MSTATWAACLDAFAEHLHEQRTALHEGQAQRCTAFRPHEGLGPLPPALRPRAGELLAQAEALSSSLQDALSGTGAELAGLRRRAAPSRPSYVDAHC